MDGQTDYSQSIAIGLCSYLSEESGAAMAWTVQKLIDDRITVTAYCHRSSCNHHQEIDLKALRERLGPDAPAMHDDLMPKLKCSRCGSKKVGLIYSPPMTKENQFRPNAYQAMKGR